jgi:hypothetical protein
MGAIDIYKAMEKFRSNLTMPLARATNKSYKKKYITLGDVISSVDGAMIGTGLSWCQTIRPMMPYLQIVTKVTHATGGEIELPGMIVAVGTDIQAAGSAITYARRYSLITALGITADVDDDGEAVMRVTPRGAPVSDESADATAAPSSPVSAPIAETASVSHIRQAHPRRTPRYQQLWRSGKNNFRDYHDYISGMEGGYRDGE